MPNSKNDSVKQKVNPIGATTLERTVNGAELKLEVSPCSRMYPGYGLQVHITIGNKGGNTTILDKSVLYEKATKDDLNRLFDKVSIIKCKQCAKPAFDPVVHTKTRNGLCEECALSDFRKGLEASKAKELLRVQKADEKKKKLGFTHKVIAWVHPDAGDDYQVVIHSRGLPTKGLIQAELKKLRSAVLDDYVISEL